MPLPHYADVSRRNSLLCNFHLSIFKAVKILSTSHILLKVELEVIYIP
jgi:hypothetical protein